jgi:hypothetical protein
LTSLNLANTKQERAGDAGKDFEFVNSVIESNIAKVTSHSSEFNQPIRGCGSQVLDHGRWLDFFTQLSGILGD